MTAVLTLNLPLGTIAGTKVRVHLSWLAMAAFLAIQRPHYFLLYACMSVIVLMHEFGHVWAAQRCGRSTPGVTLYVIGGVAELEQPKTPKEELFIVLSGPMVNAILTPYLLLASLASSFFFELAVLNTIMLAFNLLPAFPLDGGRIARSALAILFRDGLAATRIASVIGEACGIALISTLYWGQAALALIGLMVLVSARTERSRVTALFRAARLAIPDTTWRIEWVETK